MRMKDVIISVTGVQQGVNGPDAMELVTAGQYGQDEKETLLTWQESELTGMEGTKTSLCVQPRYGRYDRRPQPVFHPRAGAAPEPYQRCHISQLSDPYEASLVQREVANPKGLTEGLQTALLAK